MLIWKLIGAIVMMAASIGILVSDYSNINTFKKVGLLGTAVANLIVLLDHYWRYRKSKLLKAEIEGNASRITGWLIDNQAEFEKNGISERSLARAINISTEEAITAIDRLENREAVIRHLVAFTDPPRILIKPGRHWAPTRLLLD